MNVLYLTSAATSDSGWGRTSEEFIAAAQKLGICPTIFSQIKLGTKDTFLNAWKLRTAARAHDLIHGLTEPTFPLGYLLALFSGKPLFLSVHGTYGNVLANTTLGRKALQRATVVALPSRYTQEQLLSVAPEIAGKTKIIPWAVPARYQNVQIPPWHEREPIVLMVGETKPRKGTLAVVEALALVRKAVADASLCIVGEVKESAYVNKVRQRITELGLEDAVTWTRKVSEDDLLRRYQRARVLAMPTVHTEGSFEGFGLVHLEAHACGLPSIGTAGSAHEEIIKEGKNGYLVDIQREDELANRIVSLLSNKLEWSAFSSRAYELAHQRTWAEVVQLSYELPSEGAASSALMSVGALLAQRQRRRSGALRNEGQTFKGS